MFKSLLTAISLAVALSASAAIPAAHAIKRTPAKVTRNAAPRKAAPVRKAAPEGEWKSLGQGTWYEEFFSYYQVCDLGESWPVEIEESVSTPGYYRILPYGEGTPVATAMEGADTEAYFYIDATNPDKVFNDGDYMPFGIFMFSHCVPENEWDIDDSYYGTLSDGVITFPAASFSEYYSEDQVNYEWVDANPEGAMKIALPGAVVKDYSLSLSAPICSDNATSEISVAKGADVASVKYMIAGYYLEPDDVENADIEASAADYTDLTADVISAAGTHGLNTCLAVAFDADGNVCNKATCYFFSLGDDADSTTWNPLEGATATISEGIISGLFTDIAAETLTCDVEEDAATPGRYRLINPYMGHSYAAYTTNHQNHGYHLYVDASNPDAVVIEPSVTGLDLGYGNIWMWSAAGYLREAGFDDSDIAAAGYAGTLNTETGEITFPDENLFVAMPDYNRGRIIEGGKDMKITIDKGETNAIAEINAGAAAKVAVYDLQGRRLASPACGINIINGRKFLIAK